MMRIFSGKKPANPGLQDLDESDRTDATVDVSNQSASSEQVDKEWSASSARRVHFIDEISDSFVPANVRRSASVVTQIQTRPYTTPSEKKTLFYSPGDINKFRSQTTLEMIFERATRGGYSSQSYFS